MLVGGPLRTQALLPAVGDAEPARLRAVLRRLHVLNMVALERDALHADVYRLTTFGKQVLSEVHAWTPLRRSLAAQEARLERLGGRTLAEAEADEPTDPTQAPPQNRV